MKYIDVKEIFKPMQYTNKKTITEQQMVDFMAETDRFPIPEAL